MTPAQKTHAARGLQRMNGINRRARPTVPPARTTPSIRKNSSSSTSWPPTAALYSTAVDLTAAVNQLLADGWTIEADDVATLSPLITHTIRRFGDWHLDLTPPEATGDGHLALPQRVGRAVEKKVYR